MPQTPQTVRIAYRPQAWVPDGADALWRTSDYAGIETNGMYIRRPGPDADMTAWRQALDRVRTTARDSSSQRTVAVTYRGVRAWVRLRPSLGRAMNLRTGERVRLTMEARLLSGNPEVCLAFDFLNRSTDAWSGWSEVRATATLPASGAWTTVVLEAYVPDHAAETWANPIVGQDATRNAEAARWEIRSLTLEAPDAPGRRSAIEKAMADLSEPPRLTAIYDRADMAWASRNFACCFLFLYDEQVYDREMRRFRTKELIARWQREFGGVDSVVLWQAYPRIGADERNQFDFYRDMPGGIAGMRRLVDDLHRHGIRSFIAYNPWDTGTRREGASDADALARMVRDLDADGIFLDTMIEAPVGLRKAVDAARKGVVFEPEGMPPIEQLGLCSSSWAQWFAEYPEPGILLHKWIEPRHMQHQIRRWNGDHRAEIRSAFLNGIGMLIWENIFGPHNPWSEEDKGSWRRLVPILRRFADALCGEGWEPMVGNRDGGTTVHRWPVGDGADLYLFWSPDPAPTCASLGIPVSGFGGEDALTGKPIRGASARLATVDGLGAVVIRRKGDAALPLPVRPRIVTAGELPERPFERIPEPTRPVDPAQPPSGMVRVEGARVRMHLQHERRELGCVPDPGAAPERRRYWSWGDPFHETITHDYTVDVAPFWIDETPVTNGEYERFLRATGYRPAEPLNFLKRWKGRRCPPALRNLPVVYVDLDDARAYARWAGKRLPTEPEWQLAAQGGDGRKWPWGDAFDASRCNTSGTGPTPVRAYPSGRSPFGCYDMTGNVWQWTESERSDGHTRACIIRGGSWFDARGSIWYVRGGPQPLDTHTRFLMMHPGLDRCSTIGFRCVRDADSRPMR
ncbi:MAG: SUMF1/EgtB/PvdO family nonheme iron enzyme [Chthonomonadales bacterium]|nr:SUMF1/EgtB/PvdO family nonheme iron enzyme [Chthonomonadales bacterium]